MTPGPERWLAAARDSLAAAREALVGLDAALDGRFVAAVERFGDIKGRIVVTGLGKSGLVAAKIAATLSSTGSPAVFMHTADALHGDLGVVTPDDAVLALSKSGRSAELVQLLPLFQRIGVPIVAMVSDEDSPLALRADVVLPLGKLRDAGPEDLVPTASTTAMMALGDALAVALMHRRGFDANALAFVHAGGVIGRQAGHTVAELMHAGDQLPVVAETATLREALVMILKGKLGVTTVAAADGRLAGLLTDGDLKRIFLSERGATALEAPVAGFMTRAPRTVAPTAPVAEAVRLMEDPARGFVTSLVAVDEAGKAVGVIHLHDCLRPA